MARKTPKSLGKSNISPQPQSAFTQRAQANIYPDAWAMFLKLKVDGHDFDLRGREFQIPIIRDESEWIVMPKGAQMGLTTIFLVRTFHWIVKRRWHGLYLMPLKTGAIPFVQGRIDPIINSNAELTKLFKTVDNRLHKQTIHDIALRIRGTNIWTELREIPADFAVFDERDKMIEDNIPEAMARLDGSKVKRVTELSTPTQPGHGVDSEDSWHASDQHRWYVPCPHCSRRQTFTVDENINIADAPETCEFRCAYCKKLISDDERAEANAFGSWEADNPSGSKRGYHINQLHSPTQTIPSFMKNYFLGQTDSRKLRAWFNNNRGEPFVAFGDQVTPELLDKCRRTGLTLGGIPPGPLFIGVDVGNVLHVRANYQDRAGNTIAWQFKIFTDNGKGSMWKHLEEWLDGLGSFTCVIDAHPEKSEAKKLALKFHKRVWIGFEMDRPNQAETAVYNNPAPGEVGKVTIDRTAAFDNVIMKLIDGRFHLPPDAREIGEHMPRLPYSGYYHQMCQQVRDEDEVTTKAGEVAFQSVARWKKNRNPDHWHHAEMFADVATFKQPYVAITPEVGELFKQAGGLIAA